MAGVGAGLLIQPLPTNRHLSFRWLMARFLLALIQQNRRKEPPESTEKEMLLPLKFLLRAGLTLRARILS